MRQWVTWHGCCTVTRQAHKAAQQYNSVGLTLLLAPEAALVRVADQLLSCFLIQRRLGGVAGLAPVASAALMPASAACCAGACTALCMLNTRCLLVNSDFT